MSLKLSVKRINKLQSATSEKEKWYGVVKKHIHNNGGLQKGEWKCNFIEFI